MWTCFLVLQVAASGVLTGVCHWQDVLSVLSVLIRNAPAVILIAAYAA
jgi:hypothetical protein